MAKNHFNIPVFIPNAACPHQCVFCNQKNISGVQKPPSESEIHLIIKSRLSTIPEGSDIEIAFFGGTFTALPMPLQKKYLEIVQPYLDKDVNSIRISTRPDCINDDILSLLRKYNVRLIELGVQSMDNDVLMCSGRGHTANDVENAAQIIKKSGFKLGLQMMIGLPGDSRERSLYTARKIVELGPECSRIYPAIVIKGTRLEELYHNKKYEALKLQDATRLTAEILQILEGAGINVIRVGLHPSEGLLSGDSIIAGPFHQSFRELVITEIWKIKIEQEVNCNGHSEVTISVSPDEYNYAVGYNGQNKKMLQSKFKKVKFSKDTALTGRQLIVNYNR